MYEEDHAPVALNITLSEINHLAASRRRAVGLASKRRDFFEQFLTLDNYTDILNTGGWSPHNLGMCASFAWSVMLERPVTRIASSECFKV